MTKFVFPPAEFSISLFEKNSRSCVCHGQSLGGFRLVDCSFSGAQIWQTNKRTTFRTDSIKHPMQGPEVTFRINNSYKLSWLSNTPHPPLYSSTSCLDTVGGLSITPPPPKAWGWGNTTGRLSDRWEKDEETAQVIKVQEELTETDGGRERERQKLNRQCRQQKTTSAENQRSLADPNPLIHMGLQWSRRVAK